MGIISAAVLILSVIFLFTLYPEMLRSLIPGWFAGGEQRVGIVETDATPKGRTERRGGAEEEPSDGESTPKANPMEEGTEVPIFTLNDPDSVQHATEHKAPSFPAANSAQRASASMPPPPKPTANTRDARLMPPPSRPIPAPRSNPNASLRIPSTGPLPNRGPPAGSQQRVSGGLAPNIAVQTPNARGKVLLSPGHSPMDWAALTKSGNLSGVSGFQRVTPSQLKTMTGRKGKPAWSSWQGKVYNITPYLPFHPGGEAELMKAAGRDGTKLFMDVHPWVNWENMLGSCLVGVMVPEHYHASPLEEMD